MKRQNFIGPEVIGVGGKFSACVTWHEHRDCRDRVTEKSDLSFHICVAVEHEWCPLSSQRRGCQFEGFTDVQYVDGICKIL